jgi:DNA-binding transcriptional regulator GbsR (MarR family)
VTDQTARDEAEVQRFVERFADVLANTGWPRMAARVFVALLASDTGQMTSAELAERLQVSPAAVSGAVRYLTQLGLASRQREPGTRRDLYVVHDDVWYTATLRQDQVFRSFDESLRVGVKALGPGTRAAHRLVEVRSFFDYLGRELPKLYEQWEAQKEELIQQFME